MFFRKSQIAPKGPAPSNLAVKPKPAPPKSAVRPKPIPKLPHFKPDHLNQAITAAASLVMDSINKAANDPKATAQSLSKAVIPAFWHFLE